MQNRGHRGGFDPFEGFGFGGSLMPSLFGGRDPFDDPFFSRPFGSSMFGQSLFGPGMFGPSMFGPHMMEETTPSAFFENRPQQPLSRGPIIEEIPSDDEDEKSDTVKQDRPMKHFRPEKEPFVQDPDEKKEDKKGRHIQFRNDHHTTGAQQPQTRSFSYHSSTVTYGGHNGAYYTASTTRRTGGDGATVEERKEADTTTGKATHRLSRGIHDKGHTITRKLNSDGRVDTMQTLHNLGEEELPEFDKAWRGNAKKHLPDWEHRFNTDAGSSRRNEHNRGWALPSTEKMTHHGHGGAPEGRLQEQMREKKFGDRRTW